MEFVPAKFRYVFCPTKLKCIIFWLGTRLRLSEPMCQFFWTFYLRKALPSGSSSLTFTFIFFLLTSTFLFHLQTATFIFHLPPTTHQHTNLEFLEPVGDGVLQVPWHLHLRRLTSARANYSCCCWLQGAPTTPKGVFWDVKIGCKCYTWCIFMFSMSPFYVLHDPNLLMDIESKFLQLFS